MNPDDIRDIAQPLTRQQFIVCQLWDIIKRHKDINFNDYDLYRIDGLNLHTIEGETRYNGSILSVDANIAACVAAFNILRGVPEKVFKNQSHYDFEQLLNQQFEYDDESCGVLRQENEAEEEYDDETDFII